MGETHGGLYGSRTSSRRPLGIHEAFHPSPEAALPVSGAQTRRGSGVHDRHPLHSQNRSPLGVPAPGTGLRIRSDVLETPPGLAEGRRLREHPPGSPGSLERGRAPGLGKRHRRLGLPPGGRGRGKKPGPIPPTGENRVRNTTSSPRETAFLYPRTSPPPTRTTSPDSFLSLMPSTRSGDASGIPDAGPDDSSEIVRTVPGLTGRRSGPATSVPV